MANRGKLHTPEMRYITRYDYQGRHGWWVRVQRRLAKKTKPLVVSQFFADEKHGGRELALSEAKIFRDKATVVAPAPRQSRHVPDGVRRNYGYSRIEGGVVKGWYRDSRGKVHRTSASILKWTLDGAQARVKAWLAKKTRGGVAVAA